MLSKQQMIEFCEKNKTKGGVADYFAFDRKGNAYAYRYSACHAGLSSTPGIVPFILVNRILPAIIKDQELSYDVKLSVLDWLITESPWHSAFLGSAEQSLKDGYVFYCTEGIPANVVGAAMIATRVLWEYTHVSERFYALAKAGVNKTFAFLVAHYSNDGNKNITMTYIGDGHKALGTTMSSECVKNYMLGNVIKKTPEVTTPRMAYSPCSSMFNTATYLPECGWWHKKFLELISKDTEGKKHDSPFAKAKSEDIVTKSFSLDEFVKRVAKNADAYLKEIGAINA